MYQLLIDEMVQEKDMREYPPVESIFVCMKPLQTNGLVLQDSLVIERRLVNVRTVDQILSFELFNAVGKQIGRAYVQKV